MALRLQTISKQWRIWRTALVATLGIGLATTSAQAQEVRAYGFAPVAGTFAPLVGGTSVTAVQADDALSAALPLGFSFTFDGTAYTTVKASSNGFLTFNSAATASTAGNNLATGAASIRPLVAPLWDDLGGGTGTASYSTTGTAPNRVFTFEWLSWKWNYSSAADAISFQAKLYETTNQVEFVYQQGAGALTSPSASIGLSGTGTGQDTFLSLRSVTATPQVSFSSEVTTLAAKPANGQVYRFTPPATTPVCPAPRALTVTNVTATSATLGWTSTTTGSTYTVEYGPVGFVPGSAAGTRVPNLTGISYALTALTPNTAYEFYVTQNCGTANGNSAQSGPIGFSTLSLPPANDECANAVLLTPAATCTTTSGTVLAATQSVAASTCGTSTSPTSARDVWYQFVAAATSQTITATASFTPVLEIRSGNCATSASISCVSGSQLTATGLTVGSTYFVRLYPSSNTVPATPTFTICVVNPPANDECANAVLLTPAAACTTTSGTVLGATQSLAASTCGTSTSPATARDVWYWFVATSASQVVTATAGFTPVLEVRSGSCATSASVACVAGTRLAVAGLTVGSTYFVRVYPSSSTAPTTPTFTVCVTDAPNTPANDDCTAAQALPPVALTGNCSYVTGTNVGATSTPNVPAPGCSQYNGGDVWYSFVVPASGSITVQTDSISGSPITDTALALYSGACGSLTLLDCDDDSSPNGNFSLLSVSGRAAGEVIYVRVWEYGNDAFGRFKICASYSPPASNDDCVNSVLLTSGATCTPTSGTVVGASQSLPASTCGTGTPPTSANDVWYRFVATATGQIIQVTSSFTAAIEVRSGSCATSASVACGTGSRLAVSGLTVGTTYLLRIYNNTTFTPSTLAFTVCVSDAPSAPANDNCTTAQAFPTLVAGAGCNYLTASNVGATDTQNVPAPGCSQYNGGDVWYSFVVPASGVITVQTDSISGSPITDTGLALYSGTCTGLSLIDCDDDSSPNGNFSLIRLTGRTPGEVIYVRAWEYSNDAFGRFKVCAAFDVAPTNDEPTSAAPLTFAPDCITPVRGSNTAGSTTITNGYTNPGGCGTNSSPLDVWYRFTTAASGRGSSEATLTVTGSGSGILRLFTAASAAGPFTAVPNGCSAAASAASAITGRSFTAANLTPSTVYYVQVSNYSSNDGGSAFSICLTAPSNCPIPAGPSATAVTSTTATLGWSVGATTPSGTYTIEYGPRNFTLGAGTRLTGVTGTSTTLTGLTPDTEYCFYVRQECGTVSGNSAFSAVACFRTSVAPSPNDEPCNATVLTVGGAAVTANNIGATTSAATGYQNPGCSTAGAPRDVWFRFVATAATAQVRVTGAPAGQVRLFSAGVCAGPFTALACQASSGPNTAAGALNASGLTVGSTYYVSVSGYASSDFTGTFTIATGTVLSTGNGQLAQGEVSVYPNPSHDGTLTLSLRGVDGVSSTQVELFNALGQRVLTQPVSIRGGAVEQPLAVRNLAKGIYTLRAQIGQTTITRKVVLE
jgi:hypothetical protein